MKIELRAAEGGDHAKRIVNDLAKAYTKYLDARH
jgi:protein subunit release factor A